jgi:hypothetical protein
MKRTSWLILALVALASSPSVSDTYLVYSQGGIPPGTDIYTWCSLGQPCDFLGFDQCGAPEGGTFLQMTDVSWAGFGIFNLSGYVDMTGYADGDLRFFVKSPKDLKIELECGNGAKQTLADLDGDGTVMPGWDGTDTWQEIVVPICDFWGGTCVEPATTDCLSALYSPFIATVENLGDVVTSYSVDYVRWVTPNGIPPSESTVSVSGHQLLVDGEPFVVDGMAYAPIGIGDDWRGAWRDRPDRYLHDFPLIAASGANTVRLYAPILSQGLLDAAWAEGLYVIPTYGVDAIQLSCPEGRAAMQDRFVEMVQEWQDHPAILAWLIGNEVNTNLGGVDLCTEWYPQLDAMAAAAHAVEGDSFHPIGTAVADVGDICVPGCSDDTTLQNIDFWGTQLYRGCSFTTAFTEYGNESDCDRPLVVTEFGVDAWDSVADAEDQAGQASCLQSLLEEADQALAVRSPGGVSSGQVIFSWVDEWFKAECTGSEWFLHDSCTSFDNFSYPDPGINEEWWGVAAHETFCSTTQTTPCSSKADCPTGETCSFVPDETQRVLRASHTTVTDAWYLDTVCNVDVVSFSEGTGSTALAFDPAAGSTDHTLYYGPLNDVSTYGYTGSVTGLGATGSSTVTLPGGSLFWVIAGRDNATEGCYGNSSDAERPCFLDGASCSVPQAANRNCNACAP